MMQKIDQVSKDFESVFLSEMLKTVFSGETIGNFFGGGVAGDVYKSYLSDALAHSLVEAGGIGIATQVRQEILKLQET